MAWNYPTRSFNIPTGWTIPVLTSDVLTNAVIDSLYPYFSCSAGQQANPSVQNMKKGIINGLPCNIQYLEDGLYILSDYYNGGYSFVLLPDASLGNSLSIWYAVSNTDNSKQVPLVLNVTTTGNTASLVLALNLALPTGWVATLANDNVTVYLQSVGASEQYIYILNSNNSATQNIWSMIDFWSCIPYKVVQNMVQQMTKLAGCPNCGNTSLIETDNIYASLGQPYPSLVAPSLISYENPIY